MGKKASIPGKLNLGELIRASFESGFKLLGKNTIGALIWLGIELLVIFASVLVLGATLGSQYKYLGYTAMLNSLENDWNGWFVAAIIIVYILVLLPGIWFNVYSMVLGFQTAKGVTPKIGKSIEMAFSRFPKYLLYSIMLLPVLAIMAGPYFYVMFSMGFEVTAGNLSAAYAAMGWQYLILLLLVPIMVFANAFLIDENLSVMNSIKKAFVTTKPQYFRIILYFLLIALIGIAALYAAILFIVIVGAILYFAIKPEMYALFICAAVLYSVIILYAIGFFAGAMGNLYAQLYLRLNVTEIALEEAVTKNEEEVLETDSSEDETKEREE